MFVIVFYDIGEKRVGKILKTMRKYLKWVQNSVFEGEITNAQLEKLKYELLSKINPSYDSVIFYTFETMKYSKRYTLGQEKNPDANFFWNKL